MGNRLRFLFTVLTFSLGATSCERNPESATEVFESRSKCAAMGEKVLHDNKEDVNLMQTQLSRYNPQTNRCYVRLEIKSYSSAQDDKYTRDEMLYDGQTKELLAGAYWFGKEKSGHIFSDSLKRFVHNPESPSYDETDAFIYRFVAEDRTP